MIHNLDFQAFCTGGNLRFLGKGKPNEHDPRFSRLPVEEFPLAIGPDVPVENVNIHGRIKFLEVKGAFHGVGAADSGTIGPLGFARAHALDEHGGPDVFERRIVSDEPAVELLVRYHEGALPIEVLLGLVLVASCSEHRDPMLEGPLESPGMKSGLEVTDKPFDLGQFGSEVEPDVLVALDRLDKAPEVFLDVFSPPGLVKVQSLTAQRRSLLDEVHLIALVAQALGRHHPGNAAADHQGPLVDIQHRLREGVHESHLGHGHAHEVLGFVRRLLRIVLVDPGVLVADVGHFEEVLVEPGVYEGFLKKRLMGLGGACGHHDPVEVVRLDHLGHGVLGVLRAGIEIIGHVLDVGEGLRIVAHRRHIHHTADVDPAVADKDTDSGPFAPDVLLLRHFFRLGQGVPCTAQKGSRPGRRRTGFDDGLRDVLGTLESAAHINAFLGGGHRSKGTRLAELRLGEVDAEFVGQFHDLRRGLEPHGKYDHIKSLLAKFTVFRGVLDAEIIGTGHGFHGVNPGPDKANPVFFPGSVIVSLEFLSVGPHVHVENGAVQVAARMFLGDDRFFDGIHAAD